MLSTNQQTDLSEEDRLDLIFHALADKTRRALLANLADKGPSMITELAEPFDMSLPAVSRHIKVLESAELVGRAVDGRVHRCTLDVGALRHVEQWLTYYRYFWSNTLDKLAKHVEEDVSE